MTEALARCGVKTVRFDTGRGGRTELNQEDYIYQLAFAKKQGVICDLAINFAMTYYCNLNDTAKDEEVIRQFLIAQCSLKARRHKMRIKPDTQAAIVDFAFKIATGSDVCKKCNGIGKYIAKVEKVNTIQVCRKCDGTGYNKVTNSKKAKGCGLAGNNAWKPSHELLYNRIYDIVRGWQREVGKAIGLLRT